MKTYRLFLLHLFLYIFSISAKGQNQLFSSSKILDNQSLINRADSNAVKTLLRTALYFTYKLTSNAADLNKSVDYANKGLELSRKIKFTAGEGISYVVLSEILTKKKDANQLAVNDRQAVLFFKKHPFPTEEIDADLETGNYYNARITEKLNEKIDFYETVVRLMKTTYPVSLKLARALRNLGNLHMYVRSDEPKALGELKESLAIYQANGREQLQDLYGLLAGLLSDLDNYREALNYGLLAIKSVEKFKDSSKTACAAYDNLGTLYYGVDDLANAVKFHKRGLEIARKTKNLIFIVDITHDLSVVYSKLHQPAKAIPDLRYALNMWPTIADTARKCLIVSDLLSAYTATKQYDLAQPLVNPLMKLILEIHDDDNPATNNARVLLIRFFLATRQYSNILPILKSYREYAIRRKTVKPLSMVELYAYKVDSAQQHYLPAINHFLSFKALSDSVNKRNQDKQLAVLQVQYETEKKNQEIASKSKNISLLTRQTELQKSTLKSQQLSRNLLFAGIALLVLLLGISYSRYRIKQQANHELSEQREEINTQNESLKQLLVEREWLIKEIHHRVKNNLQIVISLLNSQSAYLKDPGMLHVLKESQNRMRSISLIHQKLYQSDNLSGVGIFQYIQELVDHLQDSFDTKGRIAFLLDIDKVTMDVSQAVPIGLILNEAITNSIKYAFEGGGNNQIRITLKISGKNQISLSIADNGKGLPEGFGTEKLKSLGMNLIKGLSRQIGAKLELKNENGLLIELSGIKAQF